MGIHLRLVERFLRRGKRAFLGYGVVVQRCLIARSLLSSFGIQATVANARFCKPLDIDLIRMLCQQHNFLITVEEGTVGGFGSHVSQFISLDGLLDGRIKWRPIVLPDKYIEQATRHGWPNCSSHSGSNCIETHSIRHEKNSHHVVSYRGSRDCHGRCLCAPLRRSTVQPAVFCAPDACYNPTLIYALGGVYILRTLCFDDHDVA